MADIKFTGDEDEALVELVKQNPMLFDAQLELYKDLNARDNIWKDIGEKMGKDDGECRKRWKRIRDSYNRFKRKRKMLPDSVPPPKNSKWELFDRITFLESFINDGSSIDEPQSSEMETQTKNIDFFTVEVPPHSSAHEHPGEPLSKKPRKNDQDNGLTTFDDDDLHTFGNYVGAMLKKFSTPLKILAKKEIFDILLKYEMQFDVKQEDQINIL